jgi:hypothetical protein
MSELEDKLRSFVDGKPLALPAPDIRANDFNYLMRRFQATSFTAPNSDHSVLIFNSKQSVESGLGQEGNTQFIVPQPIFLSRGGEAIQLVMRLKDEQETDCTYYSVAGDGPLPNSTITVRRDFDDMTVTTSLATGTAHESSYKQSSVDPSILNYSPYPAVPRVLLHQEQLGYICFAFERFGCHPHTQGRNPTGVGVRCFYGDSQRWREAEVTSAELGARSTGNLRFETEIGEFFVPGPNSCGLCAYTPLRGSSVTCREYDIATVTDPFSPDCSMDVFIALRSLGLPPVWPPPDFLV